MAAEHIRILVADTQPLTHRAVRAVLADQADIEVVGIATTGREVLEITSERRVQVVLMAVQFPDVDGLEVIASLRRTGRHIGIILFTAKHSAEYMQAALALGATGYLLKENISHLAPAIRLVATDNIAVMPAELLSLLMRKLDTPNGLMETAFGARTTTTAQPASPIGWENVSGPSVTSESNDPTGLVETAAAEGELDTTP